MAEAAMNRTSVLEGVGVGHVGEVGWVSLQFAHACGWLLCAVLWRAEYECVGVAITDS